jgi:hypothetical protein
MSGYDRDLERVVVDGGRIRIPVFEFETHLERTGSVDLKTECAVDGWSECPTAASTGTGRTSVSCLWNPLSSGALLVTFLRCPILT